MRRRVGLGGLVLLGLLGLLIQREKAPPPPAISTPDAEPARVEALIGEVLLERYAHPDTTIQDDLQAVQRVLMTVRTLVKTLDPGRMAVNEDVVEVLLGKNPYKERFLPDEHPAINANGQLVDRWGIPLFFHLETADRLDVRSGGPDKRLFTEDDVHLHADGAFMEREKLVAPAVHETRF